MYAAIDIPVVAKLADLAYDAWAKNRLKLTGRPDLTRVLELRAAREAAGGKSCGVLKDGEACEL